MSRRVISGLALLFIAGWTLHTVVLSGETLLHQHPIAMLRSSPIENQEHPPGGYRQAIIAAGTILPPSASVAIVNRTNFVTNYAYYWATFKLYPHHIWMAASPAAAAEGAPDYILDIRDPPQGEPVPPQGYSMADARSFEGGTVMVVLTHA